MTFENINDKSVQITESGDVVTVTITFSITHKDAMSMAAGVLEALGIDRYEESQA